MEALPLAVESASEAERRERFGLLAGNISLMPNGALHGFNRVLDFDESLTRVFRVTAIVFLRQNRRDIAAVRNLSISCCDQLLNVLVILSHSGGLLLINLFAQQLRQLSNIRRNPPRAHSLALGELSHLSTVDSE
jgi:hypothetical protein